MEDRLQRNVMCKKEMKYTPEQGNLVNEFPEEILAFILSFLTTRESARTSILSRRWRYLWRTSSILDLNITSMTGKACHSHRPRKLHGRSQWGNQHRFVEWVNKILTLHSSGRIETFRLEYPLLHMYFHFIDQWIKFAVKKDVQKLHIGLLRSHSHVLFGNPKFYVFPFELFTGGKESSLRHLSLDSCMLRLPPTFSNLSSLISLSLKDIRLAEETVHTIMSNCLCLERLSITHCTCPIHLRFGDGCVSNLKLKHLNMSYCFNLVEVDIGVAINLVSFEYRGASLNKLLCQNKAQLARLYYFPDWDPPKCDRYDFGSLACDFALIKTLLLMIPHIEEGKKPKELPTFPHLKHLVLMFVRSQYRGSVLQISSSFLEASPFLHKLQLHLPDCNMQKEIDGQNCPRHEHLKEVELSNFQGDRKQVEIAKYLIHSAIALEKLEVYCNVREYEGAGEWSCKGNPDTVPIEVRRKIRQEVPSTTKLIFM